MNAGMALIIPHISYFLFYSIFSKVIHYRKNHTDLSFCLRNNHIYSANFYNSVLSSFLFYLFSVKVLHWHSTRVHVYFYDGGSQYQEMAKFFVLSIGTVHVGYQGYQVLSSLEPNR